NIRLTPEHIIYIINHAEDQVIFVDEDILPLVDQLKDHLKTVKAYIVMTDKDTIPENNLSNVYSYEELIKEEDETFPCTTERDANQPAWMCYTSATTGKPKAVVYTQRAIALHSYALGLAYTAAMSESDVATPIVTLFHVNAWGMPFA